MHIPYLLCCDPYALCLQLGDFGLAKWKAGNASIHTRILGQSGSGKTLILALSLTVSLYATLLLLPF